MPQDDDGAGVIKPAGPAGWTSGRISRLSMSITRDLENQSRQAGAHIRLTALPWARTTFRGGKIVRRLITSRSRRRCNETPLLSLILAQRVNSGTAGSRRSGGLHCSESRCEAGNTEKHGRPARSPGCHWSLSAFAFLAYEPQRMTDDEEKRPPRAGAHDPGDGPPDRHERLAESRRRGVQRPLQNAGRRFRPRWDGRRR